MLMQDILKGSGKLVDNHTVKYSLPGEAVFRLVALYPVRRPINCMAVNTAPVLCDHTAWSRPAQHMFAVWVRASAYGGGCGHCRVPIRSRSRHATQ